MERYRFAIAGVAELLYLVGRAFIVPELNDQAGAALAWMAWRLIFVILYGWLFFDLVRSRPQALLRGQPVLIGCALAILVTSPLVYGGWTFDSPVVVLLGLQVPIAVAREELFYRLILQNGLAKFNHPIGSVLLGAVLFTLYHVGTQPINPATLCDFAASGVVLGVIYAYTRSFWLVFAIHLGADVLVWIPHGDPMSPPIGILFNLIALIGALVWLSADQTRRRMGIS